MCHTKYLSQLGSSLGYRISDDRPICKVFGQKVPVCIFNHSNVISFGVSEMWFSVHSPKPLLLLKFPSINPNPNGRTHSRWRVKLIYLGFCLGKERIHKHKNNADAWSRAARAWPPKLIIISILSTTPIHPLILREKHHQRNRFHFAVSRRISVLRRWMTLALLCCHPHPYPPCRHCPRGRARWLMSFYSNSSAPLARLNLRSLFKF